MSQSEDMTAIYDYINRTKPVTPEATRMRTSFLAWYNALSWYSKSLDSNTYNDARAKRAAFNRANKTPEIPGGLTTEQMQMNPGPKTDQIIEQQRTAERQQAVAVQAADGVRKTIRRGSRGDDVGIWQNILNIVPDKIFGAGTESRTKAWQSAHGLTADGIVGPKTWAEAAADAKAKAAAAAQKANKLLQSPAPLIVPAPKPSVSAPKKKVVPKRRPRPRKRKAVPKPTPKIVKPVFPKTEPKVESAVVKAGYWDTVKNLPTEAKVAGGVFITGLALYFNEKYKTKEQF